MLKAKRGRKNIVFLGLASLINDISSEIIMPILPLFLSSLGATGLLIGLAGGLRESIASLLKVFSGWLSDKTKKRKIFVLFGYLFSAIAKLFISFSKTLLPAITFLSIERTGKGIRDAPRDAMIAESTKKRGGGFGLHRTLDTTGGVIGALIVLLLLWKLSFSFRTIILIAALISFLSLLPLIFVKDTFMSRKKLKLKLSGKLKYLLFVISVFTLANFSYMFFILKASSHTSSKVLPVLLYLLFNIFYASLAFPFGKLADKIGKKKILVTGYLFFSLTVLLFSIVTSLTYLFLLFPLYGLSFALIMPTQPAFVADLTKQARATSLGIFHTLTGIIALPSSLIAGFLFQFSPSYPFLFSFAVSLIATILLLKLK